MDMDNVREQRWPQCKFCYVDLIEDTKEVHGNPQHEVTTGFFVCPECGLVYKEIKP